jgi:hypothetical protein
MKAGAAGVTVRRDGSIFISLAPPSGENAVKPNFELDEDDGADI